MSTSEQEPEQARSDMLQAVIYSEEEKMRTADKKVPETPEERKKEYVVVNAARLAIRQKPSMDAGIERAVLRGEELEVIAHGEEWTKVKGGYVMTEFVSRKA